MQKLTSVVTQLARRRRQIFVAACSIVVLALFGTEGFSQSGPPSQTGPAAVLMTAPLVTPASALSYYGASTTHTNGVAAWSTSPPEIKALGRALGANRLTTDAFALNVFNYIRNNINVEFRFGLGKGGRGALVDQSGTPFDQADLMVRLLHEGGVTASYQIGTIAITAQQFGLWTGLVTNLNQATQTFNVDALSACQYLADGGIPATVNGASTCTGLTGNLPATGTPIQMLHIWVSANGKLYDPSFKTYALSNGIDVSAAMGCGTASAPTCGSAITTAGMTGATTGTDGTGNYVQNFNDTGTAGLNAKLQSFAVSLQAYIQTNNRLYQLQDVVGGPVMTLTPPPPISSTLPYVTATTATWSTVPDQFRTTMRVRVGEIYNDAPGFSNGGPADETFFVDELAGRRLQVINGIYYMVDMTQVTPGSCSTCVPGAVVLDINHPYAANSGVYADQSVLFNMPGVDYNYSTGAFPITIVSELGDASQGNDQHTAAYQETNPIVLNGAVTLINDGSSNGGFIIQTFSENDNQSILAGKLLGQGSAVDRIIAPLGHARVTRHHDIGVIYAAPYEPSSTSYLSVSSALSVNTTASSVSAAAMRTPVFETEAASWSMLEGSVNAQVQAMKHGLWSGQFFQFQDHNSQKLYQTGTLSAGTLIAGPLAVNSGSLNYSPTSLAYLLYASIKGGAALQSDPLHTALDTVKTDEMAANRQKYLSVSPADGSATVTMTDMVTGTGKFPESLPFVRTYHSGTATSERVVASQSNTDDGNDEFVGSNISTTWRYSGADSASNSHLGGGWTHNYQVTASYSADDYKAFGAETALDASAAISSLWASMDAARNLTFASRLAMIFDSYWLSQSLAFNAVTIDKGGEIEAFQRLPDGTFNSLKGSSRLVQTGESVPNSANGTEDFTPVTFLYTGKDGDTIDFDWLHQNMHPYSTHWNVSSADPLFKANHWRFPSGVAVTFTYSLQWLAINIGTPPWSCSDICGPPAPAPYYPMGYVLTKVSNNLGRSLTFTTVASTYQVIAQDGINYFNIPSSFAITSVADENGRHVDYGLSNCTQPTGNTARLACGTLTATGPVVSGITPSVFKYTYNQEHDGNSNPTSDYQVNAWYSADNQTTPYQALNYDTMFHTATVTDILGHTTSYFAGSVTAPDLWKRGDVVTAIGLTTTSAFDRWNSLLSSADPLGYTTSTAYDAARRETLETLPEGNSTSYSYDTRSNTLVVVSHPKPGSGLSDITTSSNYVEGPTDLNCTNAPTCNKPATENNARGYITQYCWNASTGLVAAIKQGLAAGISCPFATHSDAPETDFAYTSLTGSDGSSFTVLSSTTKWIDTRNVVTTYDYSLSNHYVLAHAITDPTGLNIKTGLTYDQIGDITAVDGPRTDVVDVTNYVWDTANRRPTLAIQPDPDGSGPNPYPATKYTWDPDGQLIQTDKGTATSATGSGFSSILTTVTTYDAFGNKVKETTPTSVMQYSFDADNRSLCTTIRMNPSAFSSLPDACTQSTTGSYGADRIQENVYDNDGHVLKELRGVGTSLAQTYATNTWTPNGKLATVFDADGATHLTTYTLDGFDRPAKTTFADSTTEQFNYYDTTGHLCSSDDQPCTRINRAGQNFTFSYDPMDREQVKIVPAAGSVLGHTVTTSYDLLNEVTSVSDLFTDSTSNVLAFAYDLASRKVSETRTTPTLSAKTVSSQYDQASNRTLLTWPDGYQVTYGYDALNHMTTAVDSRSTTLATYTYDMLGRRQKLQYNGTAGATINYIWSPEDDLTTLTNDFAGTANDVTYTNTFNPAHQNVTAVISNGAFSYKPPTALSWSFGAPNGVNQVSTFVGAPLHWDANANFVGTAVGFEIYDAENRLMTTGAIAAYAYDPNGRRTSLAASGTQTSFVHDGDNEIAEYDGAGAVIRHFVPGPAVDDYIAMVTASGTKTFFHIDRQGSVLGMSDMSGNLAEGPYLYDPYGRCYNGDNSACATGVPFRYTGQRLDFVENVYYYRARYYSSVLGFFFQTDPAGYKDDLNLYTYVGNDPANRIDPTGLHDAMDPLWDNHSDMVMHMTPRQRATYAAAGALALVPATYGLGGLAAAGPLFSAGTAAELKSAQGGTATDISKAFVKGGTVATATELTGGGFVATGIVSGSTDFTAGVVLDVATSGKANLVDNLEDAGATALGAVLGKGIRKGNPEAGLGAVFGRFFLKKTVSTGTKTVANWVRAHVGGGQETTRTKPPPGLNR